MILFGYFARNAICYARHAFCLKRHDEQPRRPIPRRGRRVCHGWYGCGGKERRAAAASYDVLMPRYTAQSGMRSQSVADDCNAAISCGVLRPEQ